MYLQYGSYRHELSEAGISVSKSVERQNGVPCAMREVWSIRGELQAETQELLTAAYDELCQAYSRDGGDLTLWLPDGTTRSSLFVRNSQTLGGTRVIGRPSISDEPGNYSNYIRYGITVEATIPLINDGIGLTQYTQTITKSGGGPKWILIPVLKGPPVRQQVLEQTPYRVTQSGEAIGYLGQPEPEQPINSQHLHQDQSQVTRVTPRKAGTTGRYTETDFRTAWSYVFESANPI